MAPDPDEEKTYWQLLPKRNLVRVAALLVVLWGVLAAKRCTTEPPRVGRVLGVLGGPDAGVRVRMTPPSDAAASKR